ncbi:MAG: metallophosphoesterase, partial [Hyphomicrobiaceae bacterium]|nr:metallophosphoesterase [Hyphomicrobiaceae bacterium]
MFRLAHLSDLHISPLPRIRRLDLMSKRVLGYANWTRNRGKRTADWVLASLLADLDRKAPDHVAVTGDLVNLALAEEFDTAG